MHAGAQLQDRRLLRHPPSGAALCRGVRQDGLARARGALAQVADTLKNNHSLTVFTSDVTGHAMEYTDITSVIQVGCTQKVLA